MNFENLIIKESFENVIQLINNKAELDEVQVWPSFYGENGDDVERSTEENINILSSLEVLEIVELDPQQIFKKIYKVENYDKTISMIYLFKEDLINKNKMIEQFEENSEEYKIENYIKDQQAKYATGEFKQEKIDVLGTQEIQNRIDEAERRYAAGEINLGEKYKEIFGEQFEYDNDKVLALIDDIVNNNLSFEDMYKKIEDQKFNKYEVASLDDILRKQYPDIQNRFNEESEELEKKVIQQRKDELNKAMEEEKERIEKMTNQDWCYSIEIDSNKTPIVTLTPKDIYDKGEEYEGEVPDGILERFYGMNITRVVANNKFAFDESKMMSKPSKFEIQYNLQPYANMIYVE